MGNFGERNIGFPKDFHVELVGYSIVRVVLSTARFATCTLFAQSLPILLRIQHMAVS